MRSQQENADPPVARLMSQTDPIFVEIKNALQEKPTRVRIERRNTYTTITQKREREREREK
jgi:hypothetical protein